MNYSTPFLFTDFRMTAAQMFEEDRYDSKVLCVLDSIVCFLMTFGSADSLLSSFVWTTEELKTPWRKVFPAPFLIVIHFCIYVLLLPITLTAFFIWLTFQHKRKPYRYIKGNQQNVQPKREYSFGTTNLCLLPEFLSRFNNNSDNTKRAYKISKRIADQQNEIKNSLTLSKNGKDSQNKKRTISNGIDHTILEGFPSLDLLLIQEAWMPYCCLIMIKNMLKIFPYIVFDAGINTWKCNKFLGNSGLMIASKYPIMAVDFNVYTDKCFADHYSAKGFLQVKVVG